MNLPEVLGAKEEKKAPGLLGRETGLGLFIKVCRKRDKERSWLDGDGGEWDEPDCAVSDETPCKQRGM